ncbi:hypothetical protein KAR91_04750 [Candidatus Pacearchaeota archaeon]|nr:hypothetical protein [Candidatus Pacearchaeota archaeon]
MFPHKYLDITKEGEAAHQNKINGAMIRKRREEMENEKSKEHNPSHGGYPGEHHCDACSIDALAKRHAEVCKELEDSNEEKQDLKRQNDNQCKTIRIYRGEITELEKLSEAKEKLIAELFSELAQGTKQPEKWEDGVIVVNEERKLTEDEVGEYWVWFKSESKCTPPISMMLYFNCYFIPSKIYIRKSLYTPFQPRPIK